MNVPPVEIKLPCGLIALVSAEDFGRVRDIAWYRKPNGYVHGRWKKSLGGTGKNVALHRFIMAAPEGYVVDHIDNDPLNNTRENLQITTHSRNCMRSPLKAGGVTKMHNSSRWRARMRVDGQMNSLGCYDTKEEAQAVIDAARAMVWADPEINALGTVL